MAKAKKNNTRRMYRIMVEKEREALEYQDKLLAIIEKWFMARIEEETLDNTKIFLDYGGYIKIRSDLLFDNDTLSDFCTDFNFRKIWFCEEKTIDYRNVEEIEYIIYEYRFEPVDLQQILGDNQVDLNEG